MPSINLSAELAQRLSTLAQKEDLSIEEWLAKHIDDLESMKHNRFFELSSDLIVLINNIGLFVDVNPAFCTTLGYALDEILFHPFSVVVHPDDLDSTNELFAKLLQGEVLHRIEVRCLCKDGSYKWVSWNAVPPHHGLVYAVGHDITSRKQTEDALETATKTMNRNQVRLQGILNSQIDLVCRYLPDTTLTYVNDAYCLFAGASREELLGKKFLYMVSEDQHPMIWERINTVLSDPQPDVRIFQASNLGDDEPKWIQWVDCGISDEDGSVIEVQAVGRDITDVITAQLALHEQSQLLQTIFDSLPLMITLFDQHGHFEMVNRQWIENIGWHVDEMNRHPDIMSTFYPDAEYRAMALAYMAEAKPGWREFATVAKNERVIPSSWTNVKLPDGRTIGIGRDLSLEKQLETEQSYSRQLESALKHERDLSELKERFISTVSHEFRTPLAIIMTSTEFIERYSAQLTPERLQQKFETILSQIHHMVSLLDDLLVISRNNRGKVEIKISEFDVVVFLQTMIDKAKQIDPNKNQHFSLEVNSKDSTIYADQRLLEHMLTNLLSNAIKYSGDGTTITIKVSASEIEWKIEVIDEGVGIPSDDIGRVFDAFHRARNTSDFPGTGLGLTIVQQYAQLQGGNVSVESELDKGTRFMITLPL